VSNRVVDAWRYVAAVPKLATHPEILDVLETSLWAAASAVPDAELHSGTQQRTHSDLVWTASEFPRHLGNR